MADWARKFFRPGGGDALLAYILFGDFGQLAACSASRYDTAGLPDGVQVGMNLRAEQPELFDEWETGPFGDQLRASGLYDAVAGSKAMLRVLGSVGDPESLDYLRDSVGVVTCLLDQGGVCVLDLQTFRWWSPADWTSQIFAAHEPQPRRHAVILFSDEEAAPGLSWYHTRGMRKFGRPDLSVHAVPPGPCPGGHRPAQSVHRNGGVRSDHRRGSGDPNGLAPGGSDMPARRRTRGSGFQQRPRRDRLACGLTWFRAGRLTRICLTGRVHSC
jgi:hypothetical protein